MSDQVSTTGQQGANAPALTPEKQEAEELRGYVLEFFTRLRLGVFVVEVARALKTVTKAVHETQTKGSVVITLTLEPVKKLPGSVGIVDSIVTKLPKRENARTAMFTTAEGELTRDHPEQRAIWGRQEITGGGA